MRIPRLAMSLILLAAVCPSGNGMFAFSETKKVPIERLFITLQQRQRQNTNDFAVTYHLARLHSMAFATDLTEVDVQKIDETPVFYFPDSDSGVPKAVNHAKSSAARNSGLQHLTNAILLYERALVLLKSSTNVNERQWLILPTELGRAWCLDQAGRREEALKGYRQALTMAWKSEVVGDFDFKEWFTGAWEDIRSRRNPIHARPRGHLGPGVCYSEEIIGYLLKLLDPVKDAKEIAHLKENQKELSSLGRSVTPILVPLEPVSSLAELVDPNAAVTFDLDGSGLPRKWGWITPKAGWLVFDADGSGQITSALQLFGNVTFWIFWRDGYAALAALDEDGDGVLRGRELRNLAVWQDRNGNGVSEPGEVRPVGDLGITAISCRAESHATGIPWSPCGVTLSDGTTRPTYDWVAPSHPAQTSR